MVPWWHGVVMFILGSHIGLLITAMLRANNENMKGDKDHGQRNEK